MVSQASPIPPGLKTYTQNPPWRLSSDLYQKVSQTVTNLFYKKVELLPTHPEYQFISTYFQHDRPTNRAIKHIYCIYNERLGNVFENRIPLMDDEAKKPAFQPNLAKEPQPQERSQLLQRFHQAASPFNPFTLWNQTHPNVYVLPLWHGTTAQKCNSICDTGFTYFGKHPEGNNQSTDTGYFGSGIYFTNSARYASDIYGDGQFLLVAWVSMRRPYPVTTDQPLPHQGSDMKKLQGRGAYENYNAHYIPVVPLDPHNTKCAVYYPTPSGQIPVLDELVVFQRDQALLRFSIEMQVDLPHAVPTATLKVEDLLTLLLSLAGHPQVQTYQTLATILTSKAEELLDLPETKPLSSEEEKFYKLAKRLIAGGGELNPATVGLLLKTASPQVSPAVPKASLPPMNLAQLSLSNSMTNDNSINTPNFPTSNTYPSNPSLSPAFNHPYLSSYPYPSVNSASSNAPSYIPPAQVQQTINTSIISSPLPSMAFGAAKWKEYFGDVGVEPPLPSNIQQILQSPCPFWPGKRVEETHLFVLVPTAVNGKPLTLKSLGELVKSPKQGNATKYDYFNIGEYTDAPASKSHWVLMTRDVLPGSRDKKYTKQQALMESYAQKAKVPYEVPHILDATVAIWMHYMTTGNRLYNDKPWTYTRCQEKYDAKWPLVVGGFSPAGLVVYFNLYDSGSYGVGGSRKF